MVEPVVIIAGLIRDTELAHLQFAGSFDISKYINLRDQMYWSILKLYPLDIAVLFASQPWKQLNIGCKSKFASKLRNGISLFSLLLSFI